MMKYLKILLLLLTPLLVTLSCDKEEDEVPVNPYDSVDYSEDTTTYDTLDENSIQGIHQDIFQPKCGTPGCHDGSFEPNFTSVMSSYSSLVYHDVTKNDASNSFLYRVVPGNAAKSVLYERITNCCFANTNDRMPQDNIGVPLPDEDIARIKAWIDGGAKDINGNTIAEPDKAPTYQFAYCIIDSGFPNVYTTPVLSQTSNRVGGIAYESMLVDTNMGVVVVPDLSDDKTELKDLVNGRLLLSYDKDDFSSPIATLTAKWLIGADFWYCTFNTAGIPEGTVVYMRYYVNDGKHASDSEMPYNGSQDWLKLFWSFKVLAGSH